MGVLLIINPGARAGRSRHRHAYWLRELAARGVEVDAVTTTDLGDARQLAATASAYDRIVAVGGDGTINEVLDGVMHAGRRDVCMGVLYAGTSPDYCRFHGIPVTPAPALDLLLSEARRAVDVVRVRHLDGDGQEVTRHFGCSCSVGLGAAVARTANRLRPRWGDTAGTAIAVVRTLRRLAPLDLRLTVDGELLPASAVNHVTVLKNPFIASGLKLDVEIAADDGRLWLCAVRGRSRRGLLRLLPRFYTGTAAHARGVLLRPCRQVTMASDGQVELEYDGDPRGFLPVTIEILPRALMLIAPPSARRGGPSSAPDPQPNGRHDD